MSQLDDWLREARANLEVARASGKFPRAEPPPWIKEPDALMRVFVEQERLMRDGQVRWACLVQANADLYHRGWIDMPAFAVHGSDPAFDDDPSRLQSTARALFGLHGGRGHNEEERSFGAMLDNELDRSTWRPVPRSLSPDTDLYGSAVMIVRLWLPTTTIAELPIPLLVHTSRTGHVLPLPQQFWPEEMRARWKQDEPEAPAEKDELRVGGVGFLAPVLSIGLLIALPALTDRVGVWLDEPPTASQRWQISLFVTGITLGLVFGLRRKFRRTPTRRCVYHAMKGHEIELVSDDEWGLALDYWAGLHVLAGTALRLLAHVGGRS